MSPPRAKRFLIPSRRRSTPLSSSAGHPPAGPSPATTTRSGAPSSTARPGPLTDRIPAPGSGLLRAGSDRPTASRGPPSRTCGRYGRAGPPCVSCTRAPGPLHSRTALARRTLPPVVGGSGPVPVPAALRPLPRDVTGDRHDEHDVPVVAEVHRHTDGHVGGERFCPARPSPPRPAGSRTRMAGPPPRDRSCRAAARRPVLPGRSSALRGPQTREIVKRSAAGEAPQDLEGARAPRTSARGTSGRAVRLIPTTNHSFATFPIEYFL